MTFAQQLRFRMNEVGMSQAMLSDITKIGRSSISQYLSGKHEPSESNKRQIALALGVKADYFDRVDNVNNVDKIDFDTLIETNDCWNVPVSLAAKLLGKSREWVEKGIINKTVPFGYVVEMKEMSYCIPSLLFTKYTGIELPPKGMMKL